MNAGTHALELPESAHPPHEGSQGTADAQTAPFNKAPLPLSLWREGLVHALEQLGGAVGVEVDAVAAWKASGRQEQASWSAQLESAGAAVGLVVHRQRLSVKELLRASPPSLPCASVGSEGWVVVLRCMGGRARVATLLGLQWEERWLSGPALAAMVGAADVAAPVEWGVAAPTAPLQRLASGGGGHGGDGHAHLSPLQRLGSLLWLEREDVGVVVVYAVAAGLLSLATPIAVQSLVGTVAFGTLLQPLLVLAILVMGALTFAAALRALQVHVVESLQQRLFIRVALDAAWRLPRVRQEAFERSHGPELVNRFFDVLTLQKTSALLLLDGLTLVLQAGIGMLVLAFYHPVLLAFDVVLIGAAAVVLLVLGRRGPSTAVAESRAKYAVAAWLEELARHPLAFRSKDGTALAEEQANVLARGYLSARRGHFRIFFRQSVGALGIQVVSSVLLLGMGGWLVIQRELTLGQLVAAELIVTVVVASLAKFGKHLEAFYDLYAAMDKLGHLVDLPLEDEGEGRQPLPSRDGALAVRLRQVDFGFEEGRSVLRGLKLELAPGEKVALVGGSGSGKSVLADLLYGLRTPGGGVVEVGGVDVRQVALGSLRNHVALVRGVEVLEGSIVENVSMGRAGVGAAEVREALAAVGLLEELQGLAGGLDTRLGPSGAPLSGGQLRRLMLARAVASRPRLLVLDGALEGLPVSCRRQVMQALCGPQAPWTLLVLASEEDEALRLISRRMTLSELMETAQ